MSRRDTQQANMLYKLIGAIVAPIAELIWTIAHQLRGDRSAWRPLAVSEIVELKKVFGDSVSYDKIRILDTKYPGPMGHRAIAIKYKIRMKNRLHKNEKYIGNYYYHVIYTAQLVHEVGHVWQYEQMGTSYIPGALHAQYLSASKYDWRNEIKRGLDDWRQFNIESQCQFIQHIYREAAQQAEKIDFAKMDFTDKAQLTKIVAGMDRIDDKDKVVDIALHAFQHIQNPNGQG